MTLIDVDTGIGEFVLTHPNIRIPSKSSYYSINEGNSKHWDAAVSKYITSLKGDKAHSLRYIGTMVGTKAKPPPRRSN